MFSLLASAFVFAIGLLFLAGMLPGMRVDGLWGALKASIVCGILSAVLGKLLFVLLTLVLILPVVLLGPLGLFGVQMLVNAALLALTARIVHAIRFDGRKSLLLAALLLTAGQSLLALFS